MTRNNRACLLCNTTIAIHVQWRTCFDRKSDTSESSTVLHSWESPHAFYVGIMAITFDTASKPGNQEDTITSFICTGDKDYWIKNIDYRIKNIEPALSTTLSSTVTHGWCIRQHMLKVKGKFLVQHWHWV